MSTSNNPTTPHTTPRRLSRRTFLRVLGVGSGVLAVGLTIGWPTITRETRLALNQAFLTGGPPLPALPESPFVWIEIDADNTARLFLPKSEMGQGIHTTLAQIAAEDLELDWSRIETATAETARGFDDFLTLTFGSFSTVSLYQPIRTVAANLRAMLLQAGAAQLDVEVGAVTAQNSQVLLTADPERNLSYGAIVAAHTGEWTLPDELPSLKPNTAFQFIGQSMPRVDLRDKVTGRAVYGFDARTEGMVYGAVARPPRYGAQLVRAGAGSAAEQPGVQAVVIRDGFAGIVATTRQQAYAALERLDLTWEGGITWSEQELNARMAIDEAEGILIQRVGDFRAAVQDATHLLEADYATPLASHAQLEPQSALANVQADSAIIHASTQAPGNTRDFVAQALGLDATQVNVFPLYIGGGFGRKTGIYASVEAAILAQECSCPVHVGWNRTEEMRYGYHRPPTRHRLRALLDEQGTLVAMQHHLASGDIAYGIGTIPAEPLVSALLGADPLAIGTLDYAIPHREVLYHRKDLPIPTGSWRGLGTFPNTFAVESFIDELAHAVSIDPLQMRLNHLPADPFGARTRAVLQAVAEAAGWERRAEIGRAYGIAAGSYGETVVAMVADVTIREERLVVPRVWCAVDPGLVVNPDGARAQVEGTIVMALSSVLRERLTIADGLITATNLDQYPLLTIREVPDIAVQFIESSDTPVGGMGEVVIGIVPAAVGNALFALTGQRQRVVPFQRP